MCSLPTTQCVLQPLLFKHLIVSPPISGFWAAGAFGSSTCVWCSHIFGHRVSGSLCAFIFFRQAFFVQCKPFFSSGEVTKSAKNNGSWN